LKKANYKILWLAFFVSKILKVSLNSGNRVILSAWFIPDTSTKFLFLSGEGMAQDVAVLGRHQPLTKIKGFVPG
jgi:hypothetical protein